ncbi:hypothetical protein [Luedemannella helvata]
MLRKWIPLAVVVAAGTLLSGCGGQKPTAPTSPDATSVVTQNATGAPPGAGMLSGITVHRTGGVAGVDETLAVTPAGAWTYRNAKTGATETGTFTPDQALALTEIASDPALPQQIADSAPKGACNDGFTYALEVSGKSYDVEDCGEVKPLVGALLAKLAEATPL